MFLRRVVSRLRLYTQGNPPTSKQTTYSPKPAAFAQGLHLPSPAFLLFAVFALLSFAGAAYARQSIDPHYNATHKPIQQTIPCCATVAGTLKLQGRADHSGIQVSMWPGTNLHTITDSAGNFSFTSLPAGIDDDSTIYTLEAIFPAYLSARTTLDLSPYFVEENTPVLITLSELRLVGGDLNGDNRVNIFDLVIVGSHYGSVGSSTGDVNGDGKVNIQDLAIAAGNFGKQNDYVWEPQ